MKHLDYKILKVGDFSGAIDENSRDFENRKFSISRLTEDMDIEFITKGQHKYRGLFA